MRIEMQIRTEAMDRVAEEGVAAHWRYKDKSYGFDPEAAQAAGGRDPLANLRQLVQVLEHGGDSDELLEHAKLEMFLDQVFVFTPKGRLVSLPRGAMPLDFAYAVHTDVGDTGVGREDQRRAAGRCAPTLHQRRRGGGDPRGRSPGAGRTGSRWPSPAAPAPASAATSARPRRRSSPASAAPRWSGRWSGRAKASPRSRCARRWSASP